MTKSVWRLGLPIDPGTQESMNYTSFIHSDILWLTSIASFDWQHNTYTGLRGTLIVFLIQQSWVRGSHIIELARLKKVPGLVLSWCFLTPLGVLLVMKILEDEWYIVSYKGSWAYRLLRFARFFCIVIYCMSTLSLPMESTDSMILLLVRICLWPRYIISGQLWIAGCPMPSI